jgi:hypothetical protein
MFWGNLGNLRCFTKRIILGEFKSGLFWCFVRGSAWLCEEGGPTVFLLCVGGFGVLLGSVHNGGLYI